MPLNIPGLLVPFQLLFRPRLVLPHFSVPDIRHLDFSALRQAGYKGAVFDKDNCITLPRKDKLVPELTDAWAECKAAFGKDNVLVVSNSVGTPDDAGDIGSESVSYHLGVPVLRHNALKPSYSCIAGIRTYFASLPTPLRDDELVVIGDRIFTDVVMGRRMEAPPAQARKNSPSTSANPPPPPSSTPSESKSETPSESARPPPSPSLPSGPLAIWTTSVWTREATAMRAMEAGLVHAVKRWTRPDPRLPTFEEEELRRMFVKQEILDKEDERRRGRGFGVSRMRGVHAHAM